MVKGLKRLPYEITLAGKLRTFCRILIVLALLVDLYLAYSGISGDSVIGCGPDSDCDKVLQSKWSKLFGIPVSLFALPLYIGLIYSVGLFRENIEPRKQRHAWRLTLTCSLLVLGAAIWFTFLQIFVIKSICPYCMAAHILGGAASLILILKAPIYKPQHRGEREKRIYISPHRAKKRLIFAGVLLALLIAGQIIYSPKTHIVKSLNPNPDALPLTNQPQPTVLTNAVISNAPTVTPTPPTLTTNLQTESGSTSITPILQNSDAFKLYVGGGTFQFNPNEVPVLGNTKASCKILSLFDYTCHYCREMHHHLLELVGTYSNRICIINLPMPLDANCNPLMPRTPRAHINSCEYAKIGLAVWRANRSAHSEFEKFVFEGENPPPLEKVRAYAENLVGKDNLDKSILDPWVSSIIKTTTSLFSTNALYLSQGQMPQVIIGTNLISGQIQDKAVLVEQLEKQFHLSK
mgnify:CR=1 FL=1